MRTKTIWTLGAAILIAALFPYLVWSSSPAFPQSFSPGPTIPGIQALPEVEMEVGRLTNETRRQHGLAPLTADLNLVEASRQHSMDMLARRFFSHQNPEGRSFMERLPPAYGSRISRSGENIWTGSGYSPSNPQTLARMIINSWLSSPGHCKNILTPGFTHLGVGVAAWGREVRATQVFIAASHP
jgi:uncharacterized protein YkwD